jgi:hypothetical protein
MRQFFAVDSCVAPASLQDLSEIAALPQTSVRFSSHVRFFRMAYLRPDQTDEFMWS